MLNVLQLVANKDLLRGICLIKGCFPGTIMQKMLHCLFQIVMPWNIAGIIIAVAHLQSWSFALFMDLCSQVCLADGELPISESTSSLENSYGAQETDYINANERWWDGKIKRLCGVAKVYSPDTASRSGVGTTSEEGFEWSIQKGRRDNIPCPYLCLYHWTEESVTERDGDLLQGRWLRNGKVPHLDILRDVQVSMDVPGTWAAAHPA